MTTSNTDDCHAWWRTVTPIEFGASERTVHQFIEGRGAPEPEACKSFARALALRQLLADDETIMNTAERVVKMMPSLEEAAVDEDWIRQAVAWLPRGQAIASGLASGVKLMLPQEKIEWAASVNRFQLMFDWIDSKCESFSIHGGRRTAQQVGPKMKI